MRFHWPAERYDHLTREAIVVAGIATAGLTLAITPSILKVYRTTRDRIAPASNDSPETVTFVAPSAPRRAVRVPPFVRHLSAPEPVVRDEQVLNSDTSSAAPLPATPVAAEPTTTSAPAESNVARQPLGTQSNAVAFSQKMHLSQAARDSLQKLMAGVWDFRTPLPITSAQRDSAGREQYRQAVVAHDEHRPIPATIASGSLPFSFLSSGPTRPQRARDSVINADNLQRLARLAERARRKRDSLLAANVSLKTRPDSR